MRTLLALPALCLLAVASAEFSAEAAGAPVVAQPAPVSAPGPRVAGGVAGPGPLLSALVGTDPVHAAGLNADAGISRPKRTFCKKCGYGGGGYGGGFGGGGYVIPVVVTVQKQPSYGYRPNYGGGGGGGYCNVCGGGGGGGYYPSGSFSQSSSSSQSSSYAWGRRK